MQMNMYLCTDVLRENPFITMHIYLIPVQDAIMFQ